LEIFSRKREIKNKKMTIEKVVCPLLNKETGRHRTSDGSYYDQTGHHEAFIRFGGDEQPMAVMCPKYNAGKKTCGAKNGGKCVYSEWRSFE
jgi:hypothetical protein